MISVKKLSKILGVIFIIGVVGGLLITLGVGVYNYYNFSDTRDLLNESGSSVELTPTVEDDGSGSSSDNSDSSDK